VCNYTLLRNVMRPRSGVKAITEGISGALLCQYCDQNCGLLFAKKTPSAPCSNYYARIGYYASCTAVAEVLMYRFDIPVASISCNATGML